MIMVFQNVKKKKEFLRYVFISFLFSFLFVLLANFIKSAVLPKLYVKKHKKFISVLK